MTRRSWRRLVRHHIPLVVASVAGTVLIAALAHVESPRRWSIATAFVSLLLLAIALGIGPWNVITGRPNPLSSDVRRDIGIWAAIVGIAHVVLGLQVHLHDPVKYFLVRAGDGTYSVRHDVFGITNYLGVVATLLLAVLLALSTDVSLRYLGTLKWKSLQRWTYWLAALVVIHGVLYELIEKRTLPFVLLFAATTVAVLVLQLRGWRRRRGTAAATRPVPPAKAQ